VGNQAAQQAIFYNIRIREMLSSNTQFSIPASGWQTATDPKTVTVVVTYIPGIGQPANPPFPNPNVLNMGSAFKIAIPATYKLVSPPSIASPSNSGNGNGNNGGGGGNGGGNGGGGNGGGPKK
jgi:uncharacterized membrane protein YgcG